MKKSICNYSIIVLILFSLINCREKKKSNNQHVIINKNEVLVSDLISNDSVIIAVIGAKTCTNQFGNTFCKLYDSLSITKNLYIVYSDKDKLECLRNKYNNTYVNLSTKEINKRGIYNIYHTYFFIYNKKIYKKLFINHE